jgi:ATP-binding cassette subfamily B protein
MLPLPLLSYSIYQVSRKINLGNKKIQEQLSLLTTKAQETFAGIRVIKSFGAEQSFSDDFQKAGIEYQTRTLSLARINALFFPLMALLMGLSTIIILYVGGKEVEANRFTAGNVAEFIIYLNMLIWPVASLGWTTALVQKAAASQTRINEFLNHSEVNESGMNLQTWNSEIRLTNVSHRFHEKPFNSLNNINLSIKKGQFVGVVGKTGSGKSTLLQLLSRQIELQEGSIAIDGVDYKDFSIAAFRNQLAYVPQDVFLFSDTIRQNILLGAQDIHLVDTKEDLSVNSKLSHALRISCLEKDLHNFPLGLETVIGERGVSLSGGQKQRLAIARALMRDASILLLDDCLSAVDADTEAEIIANLHSAFQDQNLTVIMSSHRLAPIMKADQILVLNQGEIEGIGKHNLLITENEFYNWLYCNQTVES